MVQKPYDWARGVTLLDHSQRKHKVVREYFSDYLSVRCQLPRRKLRLAVVDGFAGGGKYSCGTPGSPLIFIEELKKASERINIERAAANMPPIDMECLLLFNDSDKNAVDFLRSHVASLLSGIKDTSPRLHLRIEYMNQSFQVAYPKVKDLLSQGRYVNVLFNLDQAGHTHVERQTLLDIMNSYRSAEIFYTFMIASLLSFLHKANPSHLQTQLAPLGLDGKSLGAIQAPLMSKDEWLGTAERIVFESFSVCAQYVSPFSIHNPDGWRYWMIHFANSYRARQVYNNVLHKNSSMQAHFGRSGLEMLTYNPAHEKGTLYLFDEPGRERSRSQLHDDIPRLISESGDAIVIEDFYSSIYNITPAHSDDVHRVIIENPDTEVITPAGGERRTADTIVVGDILRLKRQRSFPLFLSASRSPGRR